MDQDIENYFPVDIASISVKLVLNIPNDSLGGSLSQNLHCFMLCRNCGDLWSISFMRVAYFKINNNSYKTEEGNMGAPMSGLYPS